jgi:hypothetical protein
MKIGKPKGWKIIKSSEVKIDAKEVVLSLQEVIVSKILPPCKTKV